MQNNDLINIKINMKILEGNLYNIIFVYINTYTIPKVIEFIWTYQSISIIWTDHTKDWSFYNIYNKLIS